MRAVTLHLIVVFLAGHIVFAAGTDEASNEAEIGILEDWPSSEWSRDDPSLAETYVPQVRLAFRFTEGKWLAFRQDFKDSEALATAHTYFAGTRKWTAVLHGEKKGALVSAPTTQYSCYDQIGVHTIAEGQDIPDAGPRTEQYSGWPGYRVKRPLVLVSGPFFKDPEGWTAASATRRVPKRVARLFVESIQGSEDDEQEMPAPLSQLIRRRDLGVRTVYRSREGMSLLGVQYQEAGTVFDRLDDADLSLHWYGVGADGDVTFLGSEMELLDIGDFNGDGVSELVFWYDSYNRNGYILVWDDFRSGTRHPSHGTTIEWRGSRRGESARSRVEAPHPQVVGGCAPLPGSGCGARDERFSAAPGHQGARAPCIRDARRRQRTPLPDEGRQQVGVH